MWNLNHKKQKNKIDADNKLWRQEGWREEVLGMG